MNGRREPVPRSLVLLGLAASFVALFGLAALTDLLRHPLPDPPPSSPDDAPAFDPRTEVECIDPEPREGQEREERTEPRVVQASSGELYDCPQTFDDQVVSFRGEVVGALLRRGDGVWAQLNDDVYGLELGPLPSHRDFRGGNAGVGVLLPPELATQIEVIGGPAWEGDVVQVTGVFHRVDEPSGEVAIIRASSGEVVRRGQPFDDPPLRDRQIVAGLLAVTVAILTVLERLAARRR